MLSVKNQSIRVMQITLLFSLALWLSGCSWLISTSSQGLANNLSKAVNAHDDPETVASALPAYMLILEGILHNQPNNENLLLKTAALYSVYVGFIDEEDDARKQRLSDRAWRYAERAFCNAVNTPCPIQSLPHEDFQKLVDSMTPDQLELYYTLGAAWANWIHANKDDWNAVAQLPQVSAIMTKIVELDERYELGAAHMYLGVLNTLLPPALGGKPDIGQKHFLRAMDISDDRSLMPKVLYARHYARLIFDRELHDSLLNEVIEYEHQNPDYTLINAVARKQAQQLLISGDDFF